MGWITIVVLAIMVIYSFVAAGAEGMGNRKKEEEYQGVVSTGWIILAIIGIILLARGCS